MLKNFNISESRIRLSRNAAHIDSSVRNWHRDRCKAATHKVCTLPQSSIHARDYELLASAAKPGAVKPGIVFCFVTKIRNPNNPLTPFTSPFYIITFVIQYTYFFRLLRSKV